MLVTIISIIEWAKLIIGLILMPIGLFLVIRPFYHWVRSRQPTAEQCYGAACECIIGLIILIVAFFIAGW
jgi:hypothetical protein